MMKDTAALARLRRHRDPSGALLSVFVSVPADPTALREWRARLHALVATARPLDVGIRGRRRARVAQFRVGELGFGRGRDWFGHCMLLVASADGVLEELRLPAPVPDLAVLGRHVHLRAAVRAFEQCGSYAVVVVDRRRARLFEVAGCAVVRVHQIDDEGVRDRSHAGWHGLEEYRVRHHAQELATRHYSMTAAALAQPHLAGRPLVVGGHSDGIVEFLASLPTPLRATVTGTFVIDPHTMTPSDVQDHAEKVLAEWAAAQERRLADRLAEWTATGRAVTGIERVGESVSRDRADLLVVTGDELTPGRVCERCGLIAVGSDVCPACRGPAFGVPDVVDEMVVRMLDAGGRVHLSADRSAEPDVSARLRRPG